MSNEPIDRTPLAPAGLTYDARGLVPAVVQDAQSGEVLMLAYQSREALEQTLATGKATFFSRSRNALWVKGETSGNVQSVQAAATDCDHDAVLLRVDPQGPACHTGERSCFYRPIEGMTPPAPTPAETLTQLEAVLASRQTNPPPGSYVAKLFANETLRHKKVGEEATELVIASLGKKREEICAEAADVLFHTLVLLRAHGLGLADVAAVLREREGKRRE